VGEEGASRDDYQKTEQDNTIVQAVNGSRYALGYFGMAYYLENQGQVKPVAVEGVLPSLETAADGSYTPLSRPIFIYVGKEYLKERPEVAEFVKYYISLVDTDLIAEVGYVPLNPQQKATVDKALSDALGM
jgi:phosphate transport system substrate-binding protein